MKLLLFFTALIIAVTASVIDEQKPWDCPKNEKYWKCSLEMCYTKCEHLKIYPACPQLAPGCYAPDCLCIDGYLRNEDGVCVPEKMCLKYHQEKEWKEIFGLTCDVKNPVGYIKELILNENWYIAKESVPEQTEYH